jgi:tetratricopeptide (TPR) repeat protein
MLYQTIMNKIAVLIFSAIFTFSVFGQTESETIKKANDLIANKKYESAYILLDKFDPANTKPDVVLLKEKILLNYFVTSMMHQIFALKDLEKNEDIMDYRGAEGSFNMQMLDIDSILGHLIKQDPTNCRLYKGLGEFYYEVHIKYGGNWLKEDKELFKLMDANFTKAVDGNCADYLTYYVLGYVTIVQQKYKESIPYFLKSIELEKEYASAHYNLAYAYMYTDDRENALKFAKNSFELYTDKTYKSDAARMLGQIYSELKDDKNALANYELADTIDTGNYYNLKALLSIYVRTEDAKAKESTKRFFNLDPDNPTIYNDLEEIYYNHKKENDLSAFYKEQLTVFMNNAKVLGNLNFYLGKIYLDTDKKLAKEYLLKAKDIFNKVYDNDHDVFKAIENGLKRADQQ